MVTSGRRYGFGIIGCGVIAPTHAGAVRALTNADLIAVTDVVPDKAKAFAADSAGVLLTVISQHRLTPAPGGSGSWPARGGWGG